MKKYKFLAFFALLVTAVLSVIFHSSTLGASIALVPAVGGFSMRDLENFASQNLSSFDGANYEGDNYEGDNNFEGDPNFSGETKVAGNSNFEGDFSGFEHEYYDGRGDDFVDFGGFNKTFATAGDSGRIFVMTITNIGTAGYDVYLVPGYLWAPGATYNGTVLDTSANFLDITGTSTTNLSAVGSPNTIFNFQAFIQNCPISVAGIKIESNTTDQMGKQLIIEHLSPFKQLEQKIINLGSYINENTFKDKVVTIPTPELVLSAQTKIKLNIPGKGLNTLTTTTITFLAGAILNPTHALQQKLTRAKATIAQAGGTGYFRRMGAMGGFRPNRPRVGGWR